MISTRSFCQTPTQLQAKTSIRGWKEQAEHAILRVCGSKINTDGTVEQVVHFLKRKGNKKAKVGRRWGWGEEKKIDGDVSKPCGKVAQPPTLQKYVVLDIHSSMAGSIC
jgi:hypothetical protein